MAHPGWKYRREVQSRIAKGELSAPLIAFQMSRAKPGSGCRSSRRDEEKRPMPAQ